MKISSSAQMVTLTYETPPLSFNKLPTLNKKDYQDFMKRLRNGTDNKLKYYACGEYGDETQRPHYHTIIFNTPRKWTLDSRYIMDYWKNGQVHLAPCNMKTINYTLKYLMKGRWNPLHELDDRQPNFSLMSKNMGKNYLTRAMQRHQIENLNSFVTLPSGVKTGMPRYYKDKLYTEGQKAEIARKAYKESEENPQFTSAKQEITWKTDQIRKAQKALRQKGKL